MKLVTLEGSENYQATVVKLPKKQRVEGLDRLVKVTVFGNDILTGKDTPEDSLYVFFPAECKLSDLYLRENNEFRHSDRNRDRSKTGFFEDSGRVKAIKFKGVISTGYIAPIDSLNGVIFGWDKLVEGDEFNILNGVEICRKYKVVHEHSSNPKESRYNKKLKRFDKLVPNQFRFHVSTAPLAKNLHQLDPDDIIVITDKWHGTSAVFSNLLVKKELSWRDKLARLLGVKVQETSYDNLYSSRSVIKNQYINKEAGLGYYNEDIWGMVNKELEGKIEQGISIYGEIVGYLHSGKMIQKDYDYGCEWASDIARGAEFLGAIKLNPEHKFVVYRITYTKPDGSVIEFSWQQIKDYCKRNDLKTVICLYHGRAYDLAQEYVNQPWFHDWWDNVDSDKKVTEAERWRQEYMAFLSNVFLERDCIHCKKNVPAEGIVLRIDGKDTYSAFKLKSKAFLLKESKQLDSGEVNIEDSEAS